MKRQKIAEIPGTFTPEANEEIIRKSYNLELITPMFGGDFESWKLDTKYPVRSQSVKGQLRFWWRTMQSDQNVKALLAKENAIWGGSMIDENDQETRIKSPISITVSNINVLDVDIVEAKMKNRHAVDDSIIPGYVLFPVMPHVKKAINKYGSSGIYFIKYLTFTLHVRCPRDLAKEVSDTLKLWVLFGGVGARVHRGTGSLFCEELLRDFSDENDLLRFLQSFTGDKACCSYPRISNATLAASSIQGDPVKHWYDLLAQYGKFRQQREQPHGDKERPGRSYWPEPDAIKTITKHRCSKEHEPKHPDGIWFPRAAFGLPIQTEFNNRDGQNDPIGKFMLEPAIKDGNGGRWPSPLILKVIKLNNGKVLCVCLKLNHSFPDDIVLKREGDII